MITVLLFLITATAWVSAMLFFYSKAENSNKFIWGFLFLFFLSSGVSLFAYFVFVALP